MKCRRHVWQQSTFAKQPSIMVPGTCVPHFCDACGTRYPCPYDCAHLDCKTERGESTRVINLDESEFG